MRQGSAASERTHAHALTPAGGGCGAAVAHLSAQGSLKGEGSVASNFKKSSVFKLQKSGVRCAGPITNKSGIWDMGRHERVKWEVVRECVRVRGARPRATRVCLSVSRVNE